MPKQSKKYVVRLTDVERQVLQQVVGKFKGASQKVRRAQVLLKSDALTGPMRRLPMRSAAARGAWRIFESAL